MLMRWFETYWGQWTTWVSLGVGLTVAGAIFLFLDWRASRRRRLATFSREEDLPWDELLELLRAHNDELVTTGAPEELPPDELLKLLLARLPTTRRSRDLSPQELEFLETGAADQRANRRRWGNPTQVHLTSALLPNRLNGVVINRSTGGLAIFVDQEIKPGMFFQVRSAEAPGYVPSVEIEVKYCRKVARSYVIGCQFRNDVPWNARVWFG